MTVLEEKMPGEPAPLEVPVKPRSNWRDAWDRIWRSRINRVCLIIVAIYFVVGVVCLTPWIDHKIAEVVGPSYAAPAWGWPSRWFGTDLFGHSVFWKLFYGTRIALELMVVTSIISLSIGIFLGTVAGYFGGLIDNLIIWLYSTVSSVPWILLVIALATVLQSYDTLHQYLGGVVTDILALGLTDWVGICRLIRGEVLKVRDLDYVTAAKALGLPRRRIIARHVLPNVLHLAIITFSLGAVSYVQVEVVLAFLGLGVSNKPSWGRMIDDATLEMLRGVWWQAVAPPAALLVRGLAGNKHRDAFRDALHTRFRGVEGYD
jgi:peptide/nickel transport system permease protein